MGAFYPFYPTAATTAAAQKECKKILKINDPFAHRRWPLCVLIANNIMDVCVCVLGDCAWWFWDQPRSNVWRSNLGWSAEKNIKRLPILVSFSLLPYSCLLLLISIAKSGRWSNLCCSLKTPNALELNFLEEISIDAKTGFFALNFCWQLCHSRTIQRSEKFFFLNGNGLENEVIALHK